MWGEVRRRVGTLAVPAGFYPHRVRLDRVQAQRLSFGGVADAVIRQSGVSVLLVSSGDSHRPREKAS